MKQFFASFLFQNFFYMVYISFQYHTKMFNLDSITNKDNKDDNEKWPYRMLLIEPPGSGKTSALFNLTQKQDNDSVVDKIYLYAKDLSEPKYQILVRKREDAGIKHLDDPSAFIKY